MEKCVDKKGRWRNKVVAFRVSEEESKLIDVCVSLSGLSKQNYIINRLLNREITVTGNPRVYKALKGQMEEVYKELVALDRLGDIEEDKLIILYEIVKIMKGLSGDK